MTTTTTTLLLFRYFCRQQNPITKRSCCRRVQPLLVTISHSHYCSERIIPQQRQRQHQKQQQQQQQLCRFSGTLYSSSIPKEKNDALKPNIIATGRSEINKEGKHQQQQEFVNNNDGILNPQHIGDAAFTNTNTPTRLTATGTTTTTTTTTSSSSTPPPSDHHYTRGLLRLFQPEEREILNEQRLLLSKARSLAKEILVVDQSYTATTTSKNMMSVTSSSISSTNNNQISNRYLDDMGTFSVVIVGEYNSGKTTLINALIGTKLLETGSIPTTDSITIISSASSAAASSASVSAEVSATSSLSGTSNINNTNNTNNTNNIFTVGPGLIHYIVNDDNNIPLFHDITIVDTPGTNAVLTDHTATTIGLLPSADLIVFVTSADRPFPESERRLLNTIINTLDRTNIIIVINKMDILEQSGGSYGSTEKQRVIEYVTEHASTILGSRPVVIPVSARDALATKILSASSSSSAQQQQKQHTRVQDTTTTAIHTNKSIVTSGWERSNFIELETYLTNTLTTTSKIQTKLINPIQYIESIIRNDCLPSIQQKQLSIENDIHTMNFIQKQCSSWKYEIQNDIVQYYMNDILSTVQKHCNRCHVLLERISLYEYYMYVLFDLQKIQQEYDKIQPPLPPQLVNQTQTQQQQQSTSVPLSSSSSSLSNTMLSQRDILFHMMYEIADTIATRGRVQGQTIIEFLGKRPFATSTGSSMSSSNHNNNNNSLVGTITSISRFEETRQHIVQALNHVVVTNLPTSMEEYYEIQLLWKRLQQLAWFTISTNTSALACILFTIQQQYYLYAIGMDCIVPSIVSVPCTAIVTSLGWYVTLYGRQIIVQNYYTNIWERRKKHLQTDLQHVFTKDVVERVNRKVQEGIQPYISYVTMEQEQIQYYTTQCHMILDQVKILRKRIRELRL